jgi:hypothetical protein
LGLKLDQPGRHHLRRGDGTHLWVHDKHRKFRQYGTWHLLFGPDGPLYEKYFRDKRAVWDGTFDEGAAAICRFLS